MRAYDRCPSDAPTADVTLASLAAKIAKLEAQKAAVDAELLPVLQRGLFTVLDADDSPICCGFFVSDSGVALTVRHEHARWLRAGNVVHAVMLKASHPESSGGASATCAPAPADGAETEGIDIISVAAPHEVLLKFVVHSFSPENELDYSCMVLTSPLPGGFFQPLQVPVSRLSDEALIGAHATLLHGSIALNRLFDLDPSASLVACSIFTVHPTRVLYTAATAGGDSGGAFVISGKILIAMHVEGVNDVRQDIDVLAHQSAVAGARRKPEKKAKLSEASPSTVGAALRLDIPEISAAIKGAESFIAARRSQASGSLSAPT